jgi:RNA polymerase sigma-70 factor, ECF subfamily
MLKRYVAAFETYDVEGLTTLMRQDVTFCMPPFSLWLEGPADVRTWMLCLGSGFRGSAAPTSTCGCPAFAQYLAQSGGRAQGTGANHPRIGR